MVTYLTSVLGPLTMTSEVILEEASDQEKQNEDLFYSAIFLFGVASTGILALLQIGSSLRFY